ncbi:MAG TPA: bifunctional serine/threonine-protein kinase/formylglycine-generating enzyme family protein [Bryobacteraceae bacterium]|nr:bifunctional serine/threonine-protein kinase/formylglycine-generating enzyme family protein [Bryobacteraceae bacterium]
MDLPARLGKYELLEFLGGGMSHVYRGRDTVIGRQVAIKILTEAGCRDEQAKARFLQEARMAGNIRHDNIVAIHDYGEESGRPFIVMEFLRGQDLRGAIQKQAIGDLKAKLAVALQIARALAFVHSHNIVHRDIKPENVHLDPSGRARLMDFGIAKSANFSITQPGTALGTPYYMAPEQLLGQPITPLVDIYSFGILLYELLTGVKPIQGDTLETIFYLILNQPIDLAPLVQSGVPPAVVRLVERYTAKKPEDRPQSFDTICHELEALLQTPAIASLAPDTQVSPEAPVPRALEPVKTPRMKAPAIALGVLLVLVVCAGVYYLLHPAKPVTARRTTPETIARTLEMPTGAMLLVDGGAFPSGVDRTPITLPAFYIDRTEVSNGVYADFVHATGHALPDKFPGDQPKLPVVDITIDDARAFAKWAGKRLPTAVEWEKAARGAAGSTYPWGNEPDPRRANVRGNPDFTKPALLPVDATFANGLSPYGAYNMAGNASEFVETAVTPSAAAVAIFANLLKPPPTVQDKWCQIRGGSFNTPLAAAVTYESMSVPERYFSSDIGFRCARDPNPAPKLSSRLP